MGFEGFLAVICSCKRVKAAVRCRSIHRGWWFLLELIGGEWLDADRTPLRLCTVVLTARARIEVPGFSCISVADMFCYSCHQQLRM
jgi:hypothetical protein